MAGGGDYERTLEETPTWAVAAVCFVLVVISIFIEHLIHLAHKSLHKLHKPALVEALEKVKAELMLLGFISLLLTVFQDPISGICISKSAGATWHPCTSKQEKEAEHEEEDGEESHRRRRLLLEFLGPVRRSLASKGGDKCADKGKVAFVSAYGIHQLHIFIFVLAVFHIIYCIITYILGRTKMRKWRAWEDETKTLQYQYHNDPERFRFARDTSFGRRHMNIWSKTTISLWIGCFFRQFYGSVTKVDYMTLRHGFITAHLAPGSENRFDFQKYVNRSLEDDFKEVVGISPVLWFVAVMLLLSNTHGWFAYLWLPFIPLIIILVVGTKLQVIIAQLGLRIQDRGDVVKGAPVVQPGDDLFWFSRPRLVLFLIHFCLFQNAFQLAFFIWSVYEFGISTCFHEKTEDIVLRVVMGVIIQVLCSYVTLPLHALVTQMGSNMRPTIFNDRVATALKNWHRTAKRHTRHGGGAKSGSHTPTSSRPGTPSRGMSPVHLLHNYRDSTGPDSVMSSPARNSYDRWDPESLISPVHHPHHHRYYGSSHGGSNGGYREADEFQQNVGSLGQQMEVEDVVVAVRNQEARVPAATRLPPGLESVRRQQDRNVGLADFTFRKG